MRNLQYDALKAGCERIRSSANRRAVFNIIEEAAENADFTIEVERAAPVSEWDRLFVGSIATLLACGHHNAHVRKFFTVRGISY